MYKVLDGLCISSGWRSTKKPQKEITKADEKKKISKKLVLGKEEKGFDIVECQLKDEIISDEYFSSFSLRFIPMRDVLLHVTNFLKAPLDIVDHPLYKAPHKQNKNCIMCYNKFHMKVSIFAILEDSKKPNDILLHATNEVGGNIRFWVSYWWWVAHDFCNKGESLQFFSS